MMESSMNGTLPLWFDSLEYVTSFTFMLFSFTTIPLYWIEIIIIVSLRNTYFKGMFYQIFSIGITVDMISLLNNYIGCVFPAKGWFTKSYLSLGTFMGQMYLIIAWTSRGIQGCTVVALALNRATAVCLPVKHKSIWNSKYASLIHVLQIGIGLCVGAALVPQKFHWKTEHKGIYIQFNDPEFRLNFFISAYIIETIFVALIIIINITMLIYFKKRFKMRVVNTTHYTLNHKILSEKQRQENNLTIVAVLTCGAELIYYFYVIYVFGINTNVPTRIFYLLYDVINDMYCGLSGWLLLIYSRPMQNYVIKILRFPLTGCRTVTMGQDIHISSGTQLEAPRGNYSMRRLPSCGTPC